MLSVTEAANETLLFQLNDEPSVGLDKMTVRVDGTSIWIVWDLVASTFPAPSHDRNLTVVVDATSNGAE